MITRQKLAEHLDLSLRHLDKLTRDGVLPFFKLGRCVRFDVAEVEEALRNSRHVKARQYRSERSAASRLASDANRK